ncbi:MAG: cyclic pyranopterin monophosphate synthase MoaC [Eubacteriales bacterium]|nr:cyclic pyranopterin monophosphate synthase MoaC [Eubacteriales bacterium]
MDFTHIDSQGNVHMVDVTAKEDTVRTAVAGGRIHMSRECLEKIKEGRMKKGDVLTTAQIAGIMGAKRCSDLIPLCHPLPLSKLTLEFEILEDTDEIKCVCTAVTTGKTGVEMEALTGVSTALLTVYDMCKAVDRSMEIRQIHLIKKSGGKSGDYVSEEE